jgi:hypothetical protein
MTNEYKVRRFRFVDLKNVLSNGYGRYTTSTIKPIDGVTVDLPNNCALVCYEEKDIIGYKMKEIIFANGNESLRNKNLFVTPGIKIYRDYIKRHTGARIVRKIDKADFVISGLNLMKIWEIQIPSTNTTVYSYNPIYIPYHQRLGGSDSKLFTESELKCFRRETDFYAAENKIPVIDPSNLLSFISNSFEEITKEEIKKYYWQSLSEDTNIAKLGIDNLLCKSWSKFPNIKKILSSILNKKLKLSSQPNAKLFRSYGNYVYVNDLEPTKNPYSLNYLVNSITRALEWFDRQENVLQDEKEVFQEIINETIRRSQLAPGFKLSVNLIEKQDQITQNEEINIDNLLI